MKGSLSVSWKPKLRRPLENLSFTQSIVDTVREPLLVLDGRLRIRSANRSFYKKFQVSPEHTYGILIYDLGNHQWDIPALRELLEDVLPHNTVMTDFLVGHDFPVIGQKAMLLNARKLKYEEEDLILLAIEDITDRRLFEIEQEHSMHELASRNEELSQFAQVAGHDLYCRICPPPEEALYRTARSCF
jgi:two-component system cell cycle sensor histidine kinase PleC